MHYRFVAALFLLIMGPAHAQTIEIVAVGSVEISIETDILTPFEVMVGVALSGQAGDDIFIGNSQRQTVTSAAQILSVPAQQRGSRLPSGSYAGRFQRVNATLQSILKDGV